MVNLITRRRLVSGIAGSLTLISGCIGTGRSNRTGGQQSLSCPNAGNGTIVSCVTNHPKIDLRPTIAPIEWGTKEQSFVFRNRSLNPVIVNTAGIRIFRRSDEAWKELGNEKRVMTAATVETGGAFHWLIEFTRSRKNVLIRDGEIIFPELENGKYAATVEVETQDSEKLRCGTVFAIE